MYTVYIITGYHFPHQLHQVFFRRRVSRIEEIFIFIGNTYLFSFFRNGFISQFGHMLFVSQRKGYHPGMTFHTPLMTFAHSKSQWIISRIAIYFSGQDGVIRFDRRFVEHISPCSGLEQYGIEISGFQFIENFYQLFLLAADTCGRCCLCLRPVQSIHGCYPCGTNLIFRLCSCGSQ